MAHVKRCNLWNVLRTLSALNIENASQALTIHGASHQEALNENSNKKILTTASLFDESLSAPRPMVNRIMNKEQKIAPQSITDRRPNFSIV